MDQNSEKLARQVGALTLFGLVLACAFVAGGMYGCKKYKVWAKEMDGKAALAEAEWSKQTAVEAAKARFESSKLDARAEVERAKGVAEANEIIGVSLKDNEAYLRYLWIQGLHDGSSETIYIPTEGNLPILEATRRAMPVGRADEKRE